MDAAAVLWYNVLTLRKREHSMEHILRQYAIGGQVIGILGPHYKESSYLKPFRCEAATSDILFQVSAGHPILPTEAACLSRDLHTGLYECEGKSLRVLFRERSEDPLLIITEERPGEFIALLEEACFSLWDSNLLMKMMELPALMLRQNAVFLHASFIVVEGKAILFTAPKQIGKSTQAALWQRHRNARIINGDRALLRYVDGVWTAFGSPYCGTSEFCENGAYPIAAIVLLSQGKTNTIRPARVREAAAAFLDGCSYDPEQHTEQVLDIALDVWKRLPILCLSCLPDETAVTCLEQALNQ